MNFYSLKELLINNYQYIENYVKLKIALVLVVLAISISTIGLFFIENYTLVEALYMSVITISTVGFSEVRPLSSGGQLFVSGMIILNIGIYAYSISAFTQFVIHGELFKALHMNALEKDISQLKNHVIICGYGKYGKEITAQLLINEIPFVVIDIKEDEIDNLRNRQKKILYIHDDATHDEVLEKAGIKKANALISALPEDADNLFTVLTAHQLNKKINIVSRAIDIRTEQKLKMAGATHVISPERIGGFHMASLVINPSAINFFSTLIKASEKHIQLNEFAYDDMKETYRNQSLRELDIRAKSGVNVIGLRKDDGYEINPPSGKVLKNGESYVLLGSEQQMDDFRKEFMI